MAGLAPGAVAKSPPPRLDAYLIFFDWDKYNITPEGEQVLELAAQQWKARGGRMKVTGYTDTALPPDESQNLSEREAYSVSSRLRALGVPQDAMVLSARGQNDNRVPTGPGVREPQNRRVEIVFE
jgi:outer membrane protein OmpA-like peptidoglycan-associated protein